MGADKRSLLTRVPLALFALITIVATILAFAGASVLTIIVLIALGSEEAPGSTAATLGASFLAAGWTVLLLLRSRRKLNRPHISASSDSRVPWPVPPDQPSRFERAEPLPTLHKRPTNKAIWATVLICAASAIGLALLTLMQPDELKVVVNDGVVLNVWNIGHQPIEVRRISINGREDCKLRTGLFVGEDFAPVQLRVGDRAHWFSSCRVVRATIQTSSGVATYTFD